MKRIHNVIVLVLSVIFIAYGLHKIEKQKSDVTAVEQILLEKGYTNISVSPETEGVRVISKAARVSYTKFDATAQLSGLSQKIEVFIPVNSDARILIYDIESGKEI